VQQQVGQVALGIDDDGGNAVQGGFFQQANAQASLAGAGHTRHHGMGGQISGVIVERLVEGFALDWVVDSSEVEWVHKIFT
jgi:hypothetical protein